MSAKIIEEVFTKPLAELIWSANVLTVYPATLQGFAVGPVLPAVFYMFRHGHRRGKGRFREVFTPNDQCKTPTVFWVTQHLSQQTDTFQGFGPKLTKEILGDLLLCDALENKGHAEGQQTEVQRAYPVHFFSAWLDLPRSVAHLRFVPELLVALLANQDGTQEVRAAAADDFPVAQAPDKNLLFQIFGRGVQFGANPANLAADSASEEADYSIEELVMVRIAQACEQAPEKLRLTHGATPHIPNLRPLSRRAAEIFRSDLALFLRSFGRTIPRRALTPMLESLVGLGLWHSFLSSLAAAVAWERQGQVPPPNEQQPVALLADASCGTDSELRNLSERSLDEVLRFLDEATVALAVIRLLDAKARYDRELKLALPKGPDVAEWLNLLGQVRHRQHHRSDAVLNDLAEKVQALADRLESEGTYSEALDVLRSSGAAPDPARALAEALCMMMGEKLLRAKYLEFLDSAGMVMEPHGLVRKRRVSRLMPDGSRKTTDARSVVLSNTLLEALAHRHLAEGKGHLAFCDFVRRLKELYGFCVDEAPAGLELSRAALQRNRAILERRLRDLGLLVGVNDAEAMKHLRLRYRPANTP